MDEMDICADSEIILENDTDVEWEPPIYDAPALTSNFQEGLCREHVSSENHNTQQPRENLSETTRNDTLSHHEEDFWTKQRLQWTQNHKRYSMTKPIDSILKEHQSLRNISVIHYEPIYKSMVQGKKLSTPLPLSFVMDVYIFMWKKEGLWDPPSTEYNPNSLPQM